MQFMVISCFLATVAMVTSQETSPTQGPQVTAQPCVSGWSDWINRDKPDTEGGDYEQMTSAEKATFCPGGFVNKVECETITGTSSSSSGEMSILCTVQDGLRCNNADNAPIQCSDFRIRYRCHCSAELASTVSTAEVATTLAASPTAAITTEVTAVRVPSEVSGATVIAPVVTFPPDTTTDAETTTPPAETTTATTPTAGEAGNTTTTPSASTSTSDTTTTTTEPTTPTAVFVTQSETTAAEETSTLTTVTATTSRPTPGSLYPSLDEILEAFRKLTQTEYFQRLQYQDQILLLELTSGGQSGEITDILNSQGWQRVLSFMYEMPFNYFDTLMRFVLASLERERLVRAAV